MGWMTDLQSWIALVTLVALEIVLGIDNIIFISILPENCPRISRPKPVNLVFSWQWGCVFCCCFL